MLYVDLLRGMGGWSNEERSYLRRLWLVKVFIFLLGAYLRSEMDARVVYFNT
jgi:hypothetical protein